MRLIAVHGQVRREVDGMLRLGYRPKWIGRIEGYTGPLDPGRYLWIGPVYIGPAPEFYHDWIEVDLGPVMDDLRITQFNDWQVRH